MSEKKQTENNNQDNQVENPAMTVAKPRRGLLYGILGACVVCFVAAAVLIAFAVSGKFNKTPLAQTPTVDVLIPDDTTVVEPTPTVAYINPVDGMTLHTEQGFFYNATLDMYYEHTGVDIIAEVGSEVYAVCDGTVEAVTTDDILHGAQITLVKDDGVKTVYTFVTPVENLKAGDRVTQGQVIAKIAEPTGAEYKQGAHLHLEMYKEGKLQNPADYFTFEEK